MAERAGGQSAHLPTHRLACATLFRILLPLPCAWLSAVVVSAVDAVQMVVASGHLEALATVLNVDHD